MTSVRDSSRRLLLTASLAAGALACGLDWPDAAHAGGPAPGPISIGTTMPFSVGLGAGAVNLDQRANCTPADGPLIYTFTVVPVGPAAAATPSTQTGTGTSFSFSVPVDSSYNPGFVFNVDVTIIATCGVKSAYSESLSFGQYTVAGAPSSTPSPTVDPKPTTTHHERRRTTKPRKARDCSGPNAYGISARDRRIMLGIAEDERAAAEFWEELSNNLDPLTWIWGTSDGVAEQVTQLDLPRQEEVVAGFEEVFRELKLPDPGDVAAAADRGLGHGGRPDRRRRPRPARGAEGQSRLTHAGRAGRAAQARRRRGRASGSWTVRPPGSDAARQLERLRDDGDAPDEANSRPRRTLERLASAEVRAAQKTLTDGAGGARDGVRQGRRRAAAGAGREVAGTHGARAECARPACSSAQRAR